MVLDVCPKLTSGKKELLKAIKISTQWAERCKVEFGLKIKGFIWNSSRWFI